MCIAPLTIMRPREEWMDRNDIDPTHSRVVPCGKCPQCLKRRANQWAFRLYCHLKEAESASFITFTYSDENMWYTKKRGLATLMKSDFQKFMKRLRKKNERTISYYACGEYGTHTFRPHYHALVFGIDDLFLAHPDLLQDTWQKGHIYLGNVQLSSIRYVVGYMQKGGLDPLDLVDEDTGEILPDDRNPEFSVMSKNLGLNHLTPSMVKFYQANQLAACTLPGGILVGMPRYYKDRLFSKTEKYFINQEQRELQELDVLKMFDGPSHEVQWKKDQIRKADKAVFDRIKV